MRNVADNDSKTDGKRLVILDDRQSDKTIPIAIISALLQVIKANPVADRKSCNSSIYSLPIAEFLFCAVSFFIPTLLEPLPD